MTETWAGLLTASANQRVSFDHWCTEHCTCRTDAAKLRRLASLLEQITPEMVADIRSEAGFAHDLDDDSVLADRLLSLADLLTALAASSKETD